MNQGSHYFFVRMTVLRIDWLMDHFSDQFFLSEFLRASSLTLTAAIIHDDLDLVVSQNSGAKTDEEERWPGRSRWFQRPGELNHSLTILFDEQSGRIALSQIFLISSMILSTMLLSCFKSLLDFIFVLIDIESRPMALSTSPSV